MQIQQLAPLDHERLRTIRLRALRDAPDAFSGTLEETLARPRESWIEQLEKLATFVATLDGHDVGMVRIARPDTGGTASLLSMWERGHCVAFREVSQNSDSAISMGYALTRSPRS
jgi:hypothetical protein